MSSLSSSPTFDTQPASHAGAILSATQAPHPAAQPRDPVPGLTEVFAASLPTSLKGKARDAAVTAVKALRPAEAVKASRAVVARIPSAAKLAIRTAVAQRNAVRDARARVRKEAGEDRYAVPLAERVPALRVQREYEYGREIWDWMVRLSDQDDAEEKAAREAAAA